MFDPGAIAFLPIIPLFLKNEMTGEIAADITSSYEVAIDKAQVSVERIVDNFQTYKLLTAK